MGKDSITTNWNSCKHYFIKQSGDCDNTDGHEDVVCVYCDCPGERNPNGEVTWPIT